MKKFLIVLTVLLFASTSFAGSEFGSLIPQSKKVVPSTDYWEKIDTIKIYQNRVSGGSVTMSWWEPKYATQFVTVTFKDETRPYCWWFVSFKTKYSQGRCDQNNDGIYEYEFGSNRMFDNDMEFIPYWPTAEQ